MTVQQSIATLTNAYIAGVREPTPELRQALDEFLDALEAGSVRAASRESHGDWIVDVAVKQAILVGFRIGRVVDMSSGTFAFADKDTFPARHPDLIGLGARIVPGGSTVRRGAHIGCSVTCMPPMYVNVGAFVDDGAMIDSHALVGSCAQVGKRVHVSAAAQLGGVLEPVGSRPVIIEDDAFVGGGVGVYEGTLVRRRAVLASGVILTNATPVYDLVHQRVLRATPGAPLEIPEGAVVVPGSRPVRAEGAARAFAESNALHVACPIIIKYRDEKTDAGAALEFDLR